jgi:hypothetical protein
MLDQHPISKETDSTYQSYTQNQKLHNFLFPKCSFPQPMLVEPKTIEKQRDKTLPKWKQPKMLN